MMWRIATMVLGAALAIAAPVALRHAQETPPPPPPAVRGSLEPPDGAELGVGDDVLDAAISPDSRAIVFVATSAGIPRLWRRSLDADRAEPLSGTEGAAMPAWKGTGAVSFFASGRLRQLALGEGTLRDLAAAPAPRGASWLPDGSLLFAPGNRGVIRRMRDSVVSDATAIRPGDAAHVFPEAVGRAGDFIYVAQLASGRRVVRLVRDGTQFDLAPTSGHATVVGDLLVHVVDGALTTQRVDFEGGALGGRAVRHAFDVGVGTTGRAFFAASPRVIAWASGATRARVLTWFDGRGAPTGRVSEPADYWQVRLSPDDRTASVTQLDPLLRTLDIFAIPTATSATAPRRVSLSLSADSDPVWAPDGSRIVFRSLQGSQPSLRARPPQFSETPDQVILQSDLDATASDWRVPGAGSTPQGELLFHAPGSGTGLDLWTLDVSTGQRRSVARTGFNESDARWSPDGRWIAYVSEEPGRPEIFVARWPLDGRVRRVTSAGGRRPRWRRDGGALYFLRGDTLMAVALAERRGELVFASPTPLVSLEGVRDYEPAHLDDRLLALVPVAREHSPRARLIINWSQ
jgi:Tol biopolymer transport system component